MSSCLIQGQLYIERALTVQFQGLGRIFDVEINTYLSKYIIIWLPFSTELEGFAVLRLGIKNFRVCGFYSHIIVINAFCLRGCSVLTLTATQPCTSTHSLSRGGLERRTRRVKVRKAMT